jgi:hypothetical protein
MKPDILEFFMIEYSIVSQLNAVGEWPDGGYWMRQDPTFPDTRFVSEAGPGPGIEIKTWFPLATEITARFKESIRHLEHTQTLIAVIAWLPEYLIYGQPRLIDVWIGTAQEVAMARDLHYHHPPDYLVIEPEDTTRRTANLQQTNTSGYKFQGTASELSQATADVREWGEDGQRFRPDAAYQAQLRQLMGKYTYRLDTNFAKIDRIQHTGLEAFKVQVLNTELHGMTVRDWARKGLLDSDAGIQRLLDLE